jgi:hypothetical protein
MASKHSDTRIVFFEVRGDPHDKYYYEVENGTIDEVISDDVPHNEWVKCVFDGMKDDATLTWELAGSSTNAQSFRPDGKEYTRPADESFSTGNIVDDYSLCVDRAIQIYVEKFDGFDLDTPTIQAMAATLYINWSYSKFTKPLTADMATTDNPNEKLVEEVKRLIEPLTKSGTAHDGRALKTTLAKMQDSLGSATAEMLAKYKEWLDIEFNFQIENEPEALTDELPF